MEVKHTHPVFKSAEERLAQLLDLKKTCIIRLNGKRKGKNS